MTSGESDWTPDINMARKYMYYRFFTEAIPFGYASIQNGIINIDPSVVQNDKLSYQGLMCITDGILNGDKFVFDWTKKVNQQ